MEMTSLASCFGKEVSSGVLVTLAASAASWSVILSIATKTAQSLSHLKYLCPLNSPFWVPSPLRSYSITNQLILIDMANYLNIVIGSSIISIKPLAT